MNSDKINKITLLTIIFIISIIFFSMIHQFLMAIFMAGLTSALVSPIHKKLSAKLKGRENLASLFTVLGIILLVILPLAALITVIVAQAITVSQSVSPWIQQFINEPGILSTYVEKIPYYDQIMPYRDLILEKAGQLVGALSGFLVNSLSSFTKVTINAIFSAVIMLYVTYYFLNIGKDLLAKILLFLPLRDNDEQKLLARFTSVTRATIKGTVIIGFLQGTICGLSFAIVGIKGPVFWGSVMAVMSVVPAVGTAIIWLPALIILLLTGNFSGAGILAVGCGAIAGNLDNILRPRLVGKDTEMHDLFVLFGTLGGISMFGILGIIIGPIVTALFLTLWEIYGEVFAAYLPKVHAFGSPDENDKTQ